MSVRRVARSSARWRSARRCAHCVARSADEPRQLTKAPKLIKFVPAEYPEDKHDAGVTAR